MDVEQLPAPYAASQHTAEDWIKAVLRAIGAMRENLGDDHSLRTLAQSAWLSPFHFHRVFHTVTHSTPARFLAALRMAEAKRLLAYSPTSVTDICMQVGYSSLGTFTSQFTRMVGVSPGRFRRVVTTVSDRSFNDIVAALDSRRAQPVRVQVTVSLAGGPGVDVPAAVGLFPSGIPQQRPRACAVVRVPASVAFGDLPDGVYHPLTMCFDPSVSVAEAVATACIDGCFVGSSRFPVCIVDGRAVPPAAVRLHLRPRRETDPPPVLALPLLMAAERARESAA